jgi:PhnB protein
MRASINSAHVDHSAHCCSGRCARAVAFYRDAFGAEEVSRIPLPDGRLMSVQLRIADGLLHLADEFPEMGVLAPPSIGGTPVVLALDVADAEAMFARAVTAGAAFRQPLADMFGGYRHGQLEDPFGHRWNIAQHLGSATNDGIGGRQPRGSRLCQTCDPEVDDLHRAASIKDQVRRLNVSVHYSCPMGARQTRSDLCSQRDHLSLRQRAALGDIGLQIRPRQQLHDQKRRFPLRTAVKDRHNIRVLQRGRTLSLPLKPIKGPDVTSCIELLGLDRNVSTKHGVMRRPHPTHSASPNRPVQPIAPRQHHPHVHAHIPFEAKIPDI